MKFDGELNVTDILKDSLTEQDAGEVISISPASRWAFINEWKVEPQSDDRTPVSGGVAGSTASASAQRSAARRKHQAMFKTWSQDRHD